jgi:hypothetical protein
MHTSVMHARASHPPTASDLRSLIRAEFMEMPGLSVTLAQAARLWNADRSQCFEALETLSREGFLYHIRDSYLRTSCGRPPT